MIVSAWSNCSRRRAFSPSSSATRRSCALGGCALRPRLRGVSPASSPASRWRRHVVRFDEYRPSRRSSAPSSPGVSAIGLLNDRALVLRREPPPRGLLGHLRIGPRPVGRPHGSGSGRYGLPSVIFSSPYSNSPGGRCLTYIGTEGAIAYQELSAAYPAAIRVEPAMRLKRRFLERLQLCQRPTGWKSFGFSLGSQLTPSEL